MGGDGGGRHKRRARRNRGARDEDQFWYIVFLHSPSCAQWSGKTGRSCRMGPESARHMCTTMRRACGAIRGGETVVVGTSGGLGGTGAPEMTSGFGGLVEAGTSGGSDRTGAPEMRIGSGGATGIRGYGGGGHERRAWRNGLARDEERFVWIVFFVLLLVPPLSVNRAERPWRSCQTGETVEVGMSGGPGGTGSPKMTSGSCVLFFFLLLPVPPLSVNEVERTGGRDTGRGATRDKGRWWRRARAAGPGELAGPRWWIVFLHSPFHAPSFCERSGTDERPYLMGPESARHVCMAMRWAGGATGGEWVETVEAGTSDGPGGTGSPKMTSSSGG
ncbi:hypothetical protein L6452_36282 [Arctium lappa]|uniref:Uncharacterized protein n=1 Tax=Arctium lappa TaxID=4217 RepID=A0ACB8Y8S6_ARCLA|nr:hypothetical protein L6452_36282 [Arctium lappa]